MPHWLSSYFCAFNICTITQVYKICTDSTRVYPLSKFPFTHLWLSAVFCTLCDRPATCKGRRMELSGSWFCLCCKSHPQRWGEAERCAECKTPVRVLRPAVWRLRLQWEAQCWEHRLLSQPDPSAWIPGMTFPGSAILGCLLNLQTNDLRQLIQHPFSALQEPEVTMHLHWLRLTAALHDGWFLSLSKGLSGPGEWPLSFWGFFVCFPCSWAGRAGAAGRISSGDSCSCVK